MIRGDVCLADNEIQMTMTNISPIDGLMLLTAAFLAGALNAVAGGGSFLTLPALVFTGVPPVIANATGTLSLLPGYLSGTWGFREDLRPPPALSMKAVLALCLVGGALGAALLLLTSDATFRRLVPWLLLVATSLFACGPQLLQMVKRGAPSKAAAATGVLLVSLYGGYFNGGLGILLLALFGLLGQTDLNSMNGLKNLISALLTCVAVALYAVGGIIVWPQALLMMVGATTGGYLGARAARRLPPQWLRAGIVMTGLVMTMLFFLRQ